MKTAVVAGHIQKSRMFRSRRARPSHTRWAREELEGAQVVRRQRRMAAIHTSAIRRLIAPAFPERPSSSVQKAAMLRRPGQAAAPEVPLQAASALPSTAAAMEASVQEATPAAEAVVVVDRMALVPTAVLQPQALALAVAAQVVVEL